MSLFYWVYSKHMDLIKTLLLKLRLDKKCRTPHRFREKTIKQQ